MTSPEQINLSGELLKAQDRPCERRVRVSAGLGLVQEVKCVDSEAQQILGQLHVTQRFLGGPGPVPAFSTPSGF